MDNGRTDGRDQVIWDFDWTDCAGVTKYEIRVELASGSKLFGSQSWDSSFHKEVLVALTAESRRMGLTWKVRAKVGDEWGEWSETRTFDVEPVDTDPPS